LFASSLVALDIILKNEKKKKLKKRAQLQHLKTGHLATGGRERFVIFLTQVPDTLTTHTKTCKSSVSVVIKPLLAISLPLE
jgi:hypothetical protein